jgi:hypothetical protein
MAQLSRSLVSLRVTGGDLDPDEVSSLLGAVPTMSYRKGEPLKAGSLHFRRTGMWNLKAAKRAPEDMDGQVEEILRQLTSNLEVWRALGERFEIDLFCGWFMEETNEGLSISPKTMSALAARGIELGVDIYAPRDEPPDPASS